MRNVERRREWQRKNYLKNREAIREKARQTYLKNRETALAKQKEYAQKNKEQETERASRWRTTNPARNMWLQARKRALKKGLEFSIEVDDIVLPEKCPYLNIPLQVNSGKGFQPTSYSLDRINSTKGYVKGNIEVISNMANSMKRDASVEELTIFATNVLEKFK